VDDKAADGLVSEHGFSMWIEADDRRILFDTGQTTASLDNAGKLGICIDRTDHIVLSHGHDDHTGALHEVVRRSPHARVHCHPAAVHPRYSKRDDQFVSIAMPTAGCRALRGISPERLEWTTGCHTLLPGVGLTGPISRLTDFEDSGSHYFLDRDGERIDRVEDDMALWVNTSKGLVVCVGCCHSGLANTLNQALRCSRTSQILAVIGGFHLLRATDGQLQLTVAALLELSPDRIVPCHCTGKRFVDALRLSFGDRMSPGQAGVTYSIGGESGKLVLEARPVQEQ
jgi:7,8-dihydropterin-6-yl-methyl-4-(beta-D-ribofuranosyl)aminobenzene 5'-phosphate synthase